MAFTFTKGTYDKKKGVYTSPDGQKQSMSLSEAIKRGATMVSAGGSSTTTTASTGGSSYVDTKTGIGYEVNQAGEKSIVPSATAQEKIKQFEEQQGTLAQINIQREMKDKEAQARRTGNQNEFARQRKQIYNDIYNKYNEQYKSSVNNYSTNLVRGETKEQLYNANPSVQLGGAFITKQEAEQYPQTISNDLSVNDFFLQESITQAEDILGLKEGSSGVSYIKTEDLKPNTFIQDVGQTISRTSLRNYESKEATKEYTILTETGTKTYAGSVPSLVSGYSQADVRKQNANVIKVLFLGATAVPYSKAFNPSTYMGIKGVQRTSNGVTETTARFWTLEGKKGLTGSNFMKVGNVEGVDVFIGKTGGGFYKQGIEFPTGRIITKLNKQFFSQEVLLAKNVGETGLASKQVSAGYLERFYPRGKDIVGGLEGKQIFNTYYMKGGYLDITSLQRFGGSGLGFKAGKNLFFLSRASVEGKNIFSLGVLKLTSKDVLVTLKMGKKGATAFGGGLVKPSLKPVEEVIQLIPFPTGKFANTILPISSFARQVTSINVYDKLTLPSVSASSLIKPTETLTTIQKIIPIETQTFNLRLNSLGGSRSKSGSGQTTQQISSQIQIPKQIQVPIQLPRQIQVPKQITEPLQILKTPNPIIPFGSFIPFGYVPLKVKPSKETGFGFFGVSIRRFGKFKPIGSNLSLAQAVNIGTHATGTTLGATFKISGKGNKRIRIPFGYYSKENKGETLFIEKPKFRLSTPTEIGEIQMFKTMKGGLKI
jgi:hypothetical protein